MYKQFIGPNGGVSDNMILRVIDNTYVPLTDPANTDYQKYLEWLAAGNTPEPADETN